MILTEYNEEQHIKNEKNISYDDGFNDGIEQTKIEAIKNMIKLNVPKDKILECYSEAQYNAAIKYDRNQKYNDHYKEDCLLINEPLLNRNHKDALFRFIFKNPKDLLSLYNALNDTDYTDVSDLTVTTLEDIVYMSYKNDISFILGSEMSLFEHQSTFNPNMPLRGLFYFSSLYKKYVAENNIDIYASKRAQIPIPRYIIFYNGRQEMPERCTLRLSDAFVKKSDNYNSNQVTASDTSSNCNSSKFQPAMEITAHMININIGNNAELIKNAGCSTIMHHLSG